MKKNVGEECVNAAKKEALKLFTAIKNSPEKETHSEDDIIYSNLVLAFMRGANYGISQRKRDRENS